MTPQQQEVHLKLSSLLPSRVHICLPPKKTGKVSSQVYLARKKKVKELLKLGKSAAQIIKIMVLPKATVYNLIRRR